jgi:hypothetical protein
VSRAIGRIRFTATLDKVPGPRGKKALVTLTFVNATGKTVGTTRVTKLAGERAHVKIFGGAVVGSYRWTAKTGTRTLGRGTITVSKARMTLAPQLTLSVGAR